MFPGQVNYGSSSSIFSEKVKFPTFLRTVPPNRQAIEAIVAILLHFNWRWVAFLNSDGEYGIDSFGLFVKRIKTTDICMAYNKDMNVNSNHSEIFQQIKQQKIKVIVVFAPERVVEVLIESALSVNVKDKVWIATEAWSSNKKLLENPKISSIGTVIGIAEPDTLIPGFPAFIYSFKGQGQCKMNKGRLCNQVYNSSGLSADNIITSDPSYSFPVYSAVYTVAHALHNVLQCGGGKCNTSMTVRPYMVSKPL